MLNIIATDHEDICTPYVIYTLADLHKNASERTVRASTNQMYEPNLYGCAYRVSLDSRTCSCRRWDIIGIPYEHAYGVMLRKRLEPQDYVCHWFRLNTWKNTYADGLVPIRGVKFWPVGSDPPIFKPEMPAQPGRKKVTKKEKKRKRGINESPVKNKEKMLKRIMDCGVCGEANNSSRFHKKKKSILGEELFQAEFLQGVISQAL